MVPEVLFRLCAASVISLERDAVFVDGGNSFNPYTLSRIAKSFGAEPRKVLSRVHVARAFTEHQMEAIEVLVEVRKIQIHTLYLFIL